MPRTLLGILLVRANTSVPVDVLMDALWAGERDDRAANKLQLHVHRLRRALGDPARIRFDAGYLLQVGPGELDAERFETVLAEATRSLRPARAVELLRTALELWRGDPFGGVCDVPMLRAEADRLTERRLTALERLYAAELACGHAAAVVAELGELATRYPLRERLQGLLMTALYQAGRRAEALEVYHRTRTALVEELALEPGTELRRLEHAMLTGDPALETEAAFSISTPAHLPADITDFTGRDAEFPAICRHLAPACADPSGSAAPVPVTAVAGRAGVGKTTLAVRAAHRLRAHYPDGQLYVDLRGTGAQPLDAAEVLATFLRALGCGGAALPDDIEERSALYRSRLADRRLLVLLDNAADEAQIQPLLPGGPGCAVLVTSRRRLAGLHGAQLVDLDVFDHDQAVELLGRIAGPRRVTDEPGAAGQLVRSCGYLPLAVRVAGVRLGARPHWQLARLAADLADESHLLDELRLGELDVRASLAPSYQSLTEQARRAFRRIGLLDAPDFDGWVGAALLDIPQCAAEELLDALVDARLLDVAGRGSAGQVRYHCPDLLRVYARELVTAQDPEPDRLAAVRRMTDGWLALADQAARLLAGATAEASLDPLPCWQPEEQALRHPRADPAGWYRTEWVAMSRAVHQARALGFDELACALGGRIASCHVGHDGRWPDGWEDVSAVTRVLLERSLGVRAKQGDHLGVARTLRNLADLHRAEARWDQATDCLGDSLKLWRWLRLPREEATTLTRLAAVHEAAGSPGLAAQVRHDAQVIWEELDVEEGRALLPTT